MASPGVCVLPHTKMTQVYYWLPNKCMWWITYGVRRWGCFQSAEANPMLAIWSFGGKRFPRPLVAWDCFAHDWRLGSQSLLNLFFFIRWIKFLTRTKIELRCIDWCIRWGGCIVWDFDNFFLLSYSGKNLQLCIGRCLHKQVFRVQYRKHDPSAMAFKWNV